MPKSPSAKSVPLTAAAVKKTMRDGANPQKAEGSKRFFKTGKGDYGEGDKFLGLTVPEQREIAKKFLDLPLREADILLSSPWHEHRLTALLILVMRYVKADAKAGKTEKQAIHDLYLSALKNNAVNNWDLVDSSAEWLVGAHLSQASGALQPKGRKLLRAMAKSDHLWTRRVAMIATYYGIKRKHFGHALEIAERLLGDKHDLMHKAVGWMLREIGKRGEAALRGFLDTHAATMPRTALRYALERLPAKDKARYMGMAATGHGKAHQRAGAAISNG